MWPGAMVFDSQVTRWCLVVISALDDRDALIHASFAVDHVDQPVPLCHSPRPISRQIHLQCLWFTDAFEWGPPGREVKKANARDTGKRGGAFAVWSFRVCHTPWRQGRPWHSGLAMLRHYFSAYLPSAQMAGCSPVGILALIIRFRRLYRALSGRRMMALGSGPWLLSPDARHRSIAIS